MSELAEAIWEQVPLGAVPEHFAPRRDWLLGRVARGARVLDLGCGAGEFATALREAGAVPVGVDVAREALRRAAERDPALDLRLWAHGEPLPAEDASLRRRMGGRGARARRRRRALALGGPPGAAARRRAAGRARRTTGPGGCWRWR